MLVHSPHVAYVACRPCGFCTPGVTPADIEPTISLYGQPPWEIVEGKQEQEGTAQLTYAVQRRSRRILLDVPLIVRGILWDESPFREETFTVTVSAHGALFMLAAKVRLGEKLVLTNTQNGEERDGRVAYIGSEYAGLAQVAIEFARPAPEFWPIDTPPADWASSV
jgi:hypothetical protein